MHDEYARDHKPLVPCRPEPMKGPYHCSNCGFEMPTCQGWNEGNFSYDTLADGASGVPCMSKYSETSAKAAVNEYLESVLPCRQQHCADQ